jgi:hypothetical protein
MRRAMASCARYITSCLWALKGRAGPALGIAAFGSFIAGTLGVIGLAFMAPPLAAMALKFGPPEYFSLMVLGLTVLTFLAGGSMLKSLMMACVGVTVGNIGLDLITAQPRFTFGLNILLDGVGLVPSGPQWFDYTNITPIKQASGTTIYQGKNSAGQWTILYDPTDPVISVFKSPPPTAVPMQPLIDNTIGLGVQEPIPVKTVPITGTGTGTGVGISTVPSPLTPIKTISPDLWVTNPDLAAQIYNENITTGGVLEGTDRPPFFH